MTATPSPICSSTFARRAANSSLGRDVENSGGWAATVAIKHANTSMDVTAAGCRFMAAIIVGLSLHPCADAVLTYRATYAVRPGYSEKRCPGFSRAWRARPSARSRDRTLPKGLRVHDPCERRRVQLRSESLG